MENNLKLQEVVAIMDRSGSMAGKVSDSIGGFNSTLEILREQQDKDSQINVSVKLFDHEEKILIRSIPLSDVRPLEERQFIPRGQTALLDAMGNTLTYFMEKKLLNPNAYDCCTIYVVTDGLENASKRFSKNKIKEMVTTAETTYNIKVIYLGANQDAILEAGNLGINADQAINYSESSEETKAAYRGAAAMVARHRSDEPVKFLDIERTASQGTQTLNSNRTQGTQTENNSFMSNQAIPRFTVGAPPPVVRQTSSRIIRPSYS